MRKPQYLEADLRQPFEGRRSSHSLVVSALRALSVDVKSLLQRYSYGRRVV